MNGIMSRSSSPTRSMGWLRAAKRNSSKRLRPSRFSAIHSSANFPYWMSPRMRFISALVSAVTMRGPRV